MGGGSDIDLLEDNSDSLSSNLAKEIELLLARGIGACTEGGARPFRWCMSCRWQILCCSWRLRRLRCLSKLLLSWAPSFFNFCVHISFMPSVHISSFLF